MARFVKAIAGKGVTVQIQDNLFGFVEIAEITDDVSGDVLDILVKN